MNPNNKSKSGNYSFIIGLCMIASVSLAGDLESLPDGGTAWQAGIDGVVIEWGPDGEFQRIYSNYTQPVTIPNARGVRTAKVIAEEKAKAAIIRYMEQEVGTARFTEEITSDVEQSTAISANGGPVNHSTQASSNMMSSLSEFTSSYSSGRLRGVIKLEEGYDQSTNEAWVKVGISAKTMRAARAVRDAIANDGRTNPSNSDPSSNEGSSTKSHVRRTEQKDW